MRQVALLSNSLNISEKAVSFSFFSYYLKVFVNIVKEN